MNVPDPDLARYAATGAPDVFRRIVERHAGHVHSTALRRLGPYASLAPDVTQRVFVKLAQVARALPADTSPGLWLHRQTVSVSIDTVRSEQRRHTREQTAAAAMLSSSETAGASTWREIAPHLDDALERLPAADRAALVLRYFEERDFDAVGTALRTTAEGARKRIARALEKLRLRLTRRGAVISLVALESLLKTETVRAVSPGLMEAVSRAAAAARPGRVAALSAAIASRAGSLALGFAAAWAVTAAVMLIPPGARQASSIVAAASPVELQTTGSVPGIPPAAPLPAYEPRTVAEIVAEIKAHYERPDDRRTSATIGALLGRVAPGDYLAFFRQAEREIALGDRIDLWGRLPWYDHPAELTKAMLAADTGKERLYGFGLLVMTSITRESEKSGSLYFPRIDDAFKNWLKKEPRTAAAWLRENLQSPVLATRIFPGNGEGNLLRFLTAALLAAPEALDSPDGQAVVTALRGTPDARKIDEEYVSQLFYRDSLPDRTTVASLREIAARFTAAENEAALRHLGYRWSLRRPQELQEQVENTGFPGGYWIALGAVSGEKNNARWAEAALSDANEHGGTGAVLADITDEWMRYDGRNSGEMVTWLKEHAPPEHLSATLTRVVHNLVRKGTRGPFAMDIAMQIPESPDSDLLLRGVYRLWADEFPAGKTPLLENGKWPPERVAVLKKLQVPAP